MLKVGHDGGAHADGVRHYADKQVRISNRRVGAPPEKPTGLSWWLK